MTRASDLIQEAYIWSLAKDPNEETEGFEATIGLTVLNGIINQWSSLDIYIPVVTTLTINVLQNIDQYHQSPVVTRILEGNLTDSNNVKSLLNVPDLKRQNTFNPALVQGRPTEVYLTDDPDNLSTFSIINFYAMPTEDYTATLQVKQVLQPLEYSEEIGTLPPFYKKVIMYEMANELSIINDTQLSPRFVEKYEVLMKELKAANKKDLSVQNRNIFQQKGRQFRPWGGYAG